MIITIKFGNTHVASLPLSFMTLVLFYFSEWNSVISSKTSAEAHQKSYSFLKWAANLCVTNHRQIVLQSREWSPIFGTWMAFRCPAMKRLHISILSIWPAPTMVQISWEAAHCVQIPLRCFPMAFSTTTSTPRFFVVRRTEVIAQRFYEIRLAVGSTWECTINLTK